LLNQVLDELFAKSAVKLLTALLGGLMKQKSNMLTGSPFRSLLLFAMPLVVGNLFQQLYSIVDSIIVGKFVGQNALAAVGSTSAIIHIYIAIALGLATGCMIVFSQLLGAKHIARMKSAMFTAVITLGALSLIALAVSLLSGDLVLHLANTRDVLYDDAKTYYIIYAIGFPALFMYNIANSAFNSIGKSRITLWLLAGSSVLNVVLDLWFVVGLKWGVAGAAIATDISQYLVAVIAVIWLLVHLKKQYPTEEKPVLFEFRLLGNMLKVAIPTMLAQLVVSVGYAVLMALVNTFSVDIVSGYVSAYRLDALCSIPMVQFGNAMATFTGQNVGAKQFDRIPKGIGAASIMCGVIWVIFVIVVRLFGHQMIGWFMEEGVNEAAYTAGIQYMQVMSSVYILLGLMYVFAATLRGAGDAIVSVIAVICNFAGRCAFAYIMVAITGSELAIWWSNPIGWLIALAICVIRFRTGIWKTKRLADKV